MRVAWFLLCLFYIRVKQANADDLLYVHLVYRHGARAPTNTYPNDPHQMSYWRNGPGQLTQNGIRQQFKLGQFLRSRYVVQLGLLSQTYHTSQIYVRASKDRAIQSAGATLAGLYYPVPQNIRIVPDLPWLPIPIHSRSKQDDLLIRTKSVDCDHYDRMVDNLGIEEFPSFDKQHQRAENLTLSAWSKDVWAGSNQTVFERVKAIKRLTRLAPFLNPTLAKLSGGYLVGDILYRSQRAAENKLESEEEPSKLAMYSGTHSTMLSLIHAMGLNNYDLVPFAACIGIELWKPKIGEPYLNIWYRNDTSLPFYNLTIPDKDMVVGGRIQGCSRPCGISEALRLYSNRTFQTTESRQAACVLSSKDNAAGFAWPSYALLPILLVVNAFH